MAYRMNLTALINELQAIADMHPNPAMIEVCVSARTAKGQESVELAIAPGSLQGNQLSLATKAALTSVAPRDIDAIRESVALGKSWHAMQRFAAMKREIEALKKRLYRTSPTDVWTIDGKVGCVDRNGRFLEHKNGQSCSLCTTFQAYG